MAAFPSDPIMAYRMRWKRRRLLLRCWRKRRQITARVDRTKGIQPSDILLFSTVRNEIDRLPFFLKHYRDLGVGQFLFVVNNSTDGTGEFLAQQPDCSVWETSESYRLSRFGMDWLGWLQLTYGPGHWCVTVDADELLIYPHHDQRDLRALTAHLDSHGRRCMGALMLDMYPEGRLGDYPYTAGQDPTEVLTHFDAFNYTHIRQPRLQNQWIQGGPRARVFFGSQPARAPTLNKVPLVKWHRSYVYVSSMHTLLPRPLNHGFDATAGLPLTGALLHTKFLDQVVEKSAEEKGRKEHFENSDLYGAYYDALVGNPSLLGPESQAFEGWEQLESLGLMGRGTWE